MTDSFPRRQARTRRFTLGAPRGVTLSPDGARVTFLRSRGGTDAVTCLWTLDPTTAEERLVADPRTLDGGSDDDLPPEERARRERAREQAGGIVAYATDRAGDVAAFALSGRAYVAELARTAPRRGCSSRPAPSSTPGRTRPAPGSRTSAAARCTSTTSRTARRRSSPSPRRHHGHLRPRRLRRGRGDEPDARVLVVARTAGRCSSRGSTTPRSSRWHIADPRNPDREPTVVAYPAAGTPNALVSLVVVGLDGTRVDVAWDAGRDEYLAHACGPRRNC